MPDDIRIKRIRALFQQELARIVSRELENPIFEGKLISFPDIKVSRDLTTARVMVSVFGDNADRAAVVAALNEAESLIRRQIMAACELRRVPVFTFVEDHTMEAASRIESILDMLDIPPELPDDQTD